MRWFIILVFCLRLGATSYFLATAAGGGSDSNNGTSSGTPWLTPNHSVHCGDTITAAASTSYAATNFQSWGAVSSCPSAGNYFATLQCATFDACKISATNTAGLIVTASNWAVFGWEVTVSGSSGGSCFGIFAPSVNLHHILFANDIANGCYEAGFVSSNNGNVGVDYIAFVGNIAYNAAQSAATCASNISVYQPVKTDSLPGTHIFIAGNFTFGSLEPNPCNGSTPTDGEGIIIDTPDGSQGSLPSAYNQQIVVENNISVANGGRGIMAYNNQAGTSNAPIYIVHNTTWGNNSDMAEVTLGYCGEFLYAYTKNTFATANLAVTNSATGCYTAYPLYAWYVGYSDSSDAVVGNWLWSAAGNFTHIDNSPSFTFGTNIESNPSLASPTAPSAPSCGSFGSTVTCMATVISNFSPTAAGAAAYGYQPVSATSTVDPLFPQWLCSANIPSGLVTMGCLTASFTTGATISNGSIH